MKKSAAMLPMSESEARLRAILNTAVDAIIIIDERGHIESFNPSAEAMFGHRAQDVIGRNVSMLMPPPDSENHTSYIERYLRTGRAHIIGIGREVVALRKDGTTFPMDLAVSEVPTAHGRVFVGIARDLTERRKLEKAVVMATENERQVVGQDLHDVLGQHLTGIMLMAKSLEVKLSRAGGDGAGDAAVIAELARNAVDEARRLAQGLYPTELLRSGLSGALEELAGNQMRLHRVECKFHGKRALPPLGTSTELNLYRIAQEAVSNAIKHGRARHVTIELDEEDNDLVLAVKDDGTGMPAKRQPGPGMGLSIMKYRSSMIGATLHIDSERGEGTTVRCCIHHWRRQLSPAVSSTSSG